MNALQIAFVALCLFVAVLVFAVATRRQGATYTDALAFAAFVTASVLIPPILLYGIPAVFLWLGRVKP